MFTELNLEESMLISGGGVFDGCTVSGGSYSLPNSPFYDMGYSLGSIVRQLIDWIGGN